ncbi:MAG: formate dehydrogenase accessory protein FdhE [Rhodomicrobium sp.]
MSELGVPQGLTNIGEEAKPPFAILPDPSSLFLVRSKRLRSLATGHVLEPYLNFVADVTEAQHGIQADLPVAVLPASGRIGQALEYGIPPLSRASFEAGEAAEVTLDLLLERLQQASVPEEARGAIVSLAAAPREKRRQLMIAALTDAPVDNIAECVLVLAGLQVHFARLAANLAAGDLRPVADGICPVCGSPPMTSSVVGWPKAHNARFCTCSLCGTMWNVVRVKCVLCSSTDGISYRSIEGKPDSIKAETCGQCGRYVKILYQVNNHMLDPLSDDVASLDLDTLLAQEGWERGGHNPFLLGY